MQNHLGTNSKCFVKKINTRNIKIPIKSKFNPF